MRRVCSHGVAFLVHKTKTNIYLLKKARYKFLTFDFRLKSAPAVFRLPALFQADRQPREEPLGVKTLWECFSVPA